EPTVFDRRWPRQPKLLHPLVSNPPVGDDFFFQWTPVPHATFYQLEVGTDALFTPGSYAVCTTASTTYTAGYGPNDRCMPSQGRVHYWRVRAMDSPAGIAGIYSARGEFLYDSGRIPLDSPPNG